MVNSSSNRVTLACVPIVLFRCLDGDIYFWLMKICVSYVLSFGIFGICRAVCVCVCGVLQYRPAPRRLFSRYWRWVRTATLIGQDPLRTRLLGCPFNVSLDPLTTQKRSIFLTPHKMIDRIDRNLVVEIIVRGV